MRGILNLFEKNWDVICITISYGGVVHGCYIVLFYFLYSIILLKFLLYVIVFNNLSSELVLLFLLFFYVPLY